MLRRLPTAGWVPAGLPGSDDDKGKEETEMCGAIENKWLPPEAVMEILGCSRQVVNRLCRDGHVKCRKFGRTWYVHRSEFED